METKTKHRDISQKQNLITRLNRVSGQINGIKQMIEDDRYCSDVIIQVQAAVSALKQVANIILDEHMHSCVVNNIQDGNIEIVDEVVSLFKKLQ